MRERRFKARSSQTKMVFSKIQRKSSEFLMKRKVLKMPLFLRREKKQVQESWIIAVESTFIMPMFTRKEVS